LFARCDLLNKIKRIRIVA
jgi:hypothetical protein